MVGKFYHAVVAVLLALCLLFSTSRALEMEVEAEAPQEGGGMTTNMVKSMVSDWARDTLTSDSTEGAALEGGRTNTNSMYEFRMRTLSQRPTAANALGAGGFLARLVQREAMEG